MFFGLLDGDVQEVLDHPHRACTQMHALTHRNHAKEEHTQRQIVPHRFFFLFFFFQKFRAATPSQEITAYFRNLHLINAQILFINNNKTGVYKISVHVLKMGFSHEYLKFNKLIELIYDFSIYFRVHSCTAWFALSHDNQKRRSPQNLNWRQYYKLEF